MEVDIIENLRRELGLTREQTQLVIDQIIKEQELQNKHVILNYCPHCGHSLPPNQN